MSTEGAETGNEVLRARISQAMQDTNVTRYISAVGMVLLLYDHTLTFAEEVGLVWNARPSFAKKLYLLNRYVVPCSQICMATFMNRFTGDAFQDKSCKVVISTTFVIGVCSIACSNVLVILRIISLWDRSRYIAKLIAVGFCVSFASTIVFMAVILHHSYPGFVYITYLRSCVSSHKSTVLPGVWASPLVFEVLVLSLVISNALSRPRDRTTHLIRVLYRDGIQFFTCIASLRTVNLVISIIARPSLTMSCIFFVWAMTTLVLNRSLLNIHQASYEATHMRLPSRGTYTGQRTSLTSTGTRVSNDSRQGQAYPDATEIQEVSSRSIELTDQKIRRESARRSG